MELVTSGLDMLPERLTPKGIQKLIFMDLDKIQDVLFTVQVTSVRHLGESGDEINAQKSTPSLSQIQRRLQFQMSNQALQLEISDGIGTVTALMQSDLVSELQMFDLTIKPNAVIVIRSQISRQGFHDGQTAIILNEVPRLVINEVNAKIGTPISLHTACEQNKYHETQSKLSPKDFLIPYAQEFRQKNLLHLMPSLQQTTNGSTFGVHGDLSSFNQEDKEELVALRYPNNINKSEELAERVVSQRKERFKNKQQVLFGGNKGYQNSSGQMKLTFTLNHVSFKILSYVCYLHEGVALLRRLSRSAFIMTYNREMLSMFKKQFIEVPLYSNNSLIYCSPTIQLALKITDTDNFKTLNKDFLEVYGIRSIKYLENISKCNNLVKLTHPLHPLAAASGDDDKPEFQVSTDLLTLLEQDKLQEFELKMKDENINLVMQQMLFSVIGKLKSLKKLRIMDIQTTSNINIDILNNSLGRNSCIQQLEVLFNHLESDKGSKTAIKFPKYLKKLTHLKILNVWHRDFTETLFDMASVRCLKSLYLSFVPEVPLPNFCEALTRFQALESLTLQNLNFSKINEQLFLTYIKSAKRLKSFHLIRIEVSSSLENLLDAVDQSDSLSEFELTHFPITTSSRLKAVQDFLEKNCTIRKLSLESNGFSDLNWMHYIHRNRSLNSFELVNQTFIKEVQLPQSDLSELSQEQKEQKEKEDPPIEFQRCCQQMREFKLSRGFLTSIKPLIRCLVAFSKLHKLEISHIPLTNLQLMCIDNYLIQNSMLKTLKLINVRLTNDGFKKIAGSIEVSKSIRCLELRQNLLKNGGCQEVANILKRNKSLQTIDLSFNEILEEGLVQILQALKENKTLLRLIAENNPFELTRYLMALIGTLVTRENNTLQFLQLTSHKQKLLAREIREEEVFDLQMVTKFKKKVQEQSNIRLLTL